MNDTETIEAIERYIISLQYDGMERRNYIKPWHAASDLVSIPAGEILGQGATVNEAVFDFVRQLNLKINENNTNHGVHK